MRKKNVRLFETHTSTGGRKKNGGGGGNQTRVRKSSGFGSTCLAISLI